MIEFNDPKASDKIREALRAVEKDGKLEVLAAYTGIAGGVEELRKIMNSTGEIHIMDRGMLGMYLS